MATGFQPVNAQTRAQFAGFELDLSSGELIRGTHKVRLQGQPFQVLCMLLERGGGVVTRQELQRRLWQGDTFGDFDNGLNKAIAKLREALDDSGAASKLIETIPRRGYRFTADVNWVGSHNGLLIPEVSVVSEPAETLPPAARLPSDNEAAKGRHRLRVALMITGAVIAAIVALAMVPAVRARYRADLSWLGIGPVIRSVAVLPLANLSNDPEQEYFADGMTDELITDLSSVKSLRVLSRESTIHFKNSQLSVPEIAQQLHVDAVIHGTVLRVGGIVRTTIHLTAAQPEQQLWAKPYESNFSDVIKLQNQIAADAVSQIRARLTSAEQTRLKLESRISPEAYDEYLRGRYFLNREQGDKAIQHLEHAIQLDPNFAVAYAALGEAWGVDGVFGGNKKAKIPKALEYSQKALSLDPSSEAYTALGHSLMLGHRWNEGEVALRRALELEPNNTSASFYLALLLVQKGRGDEAIRISRELAENNPVSVNCLRVHAIVLYNTRHFDESIQVTQRALELDPNYLPVYSTLGQDLVEKGRFREAEDAFRKAIKGDGQLNPAVQAWIYGREGDFMAARKILDDNPSMVDPPSAVARYLVGDQEAGLAELDIAANVRWMAGTGFLRSNPVFDPMRNDPRFDAIVKKTGLLDN